VKIGVLLMAVLAGLLGGFAAMILAVIALGQMGALRDSNTAPMIVMAAFVTGAVAAAIAVERWMTRDRTPRSARPESDSGSTARAPSPPRAPVFDEGLFTAVCDEIRKTQTPNRSAALAIGLFVAFLVVGSGDNTWFELAALVAILVFHEAGHLVAMRLCGYRDLNVFFIPFFGAVATGKKDSPTPWQQAFVLLAGPVPGLVLAFILALAGLGKEPMLRDAIWMLAFINAFNLLPLEPLDGGRLVSTVLFSQNRLAESGFAVATSLGMAALALAMSSPLLGVVAVFGLLLAPSRYRLATLAADFRRDHTALPVRLTDADDLTLRQLFTAVSPLFRGPAGQHTHLRYARLMDALHRRATSIAPTGWAILPMLSVYFFAGMIGVVAVFTAALVR
jgi:Zn-dependent protease